MSRLAASPSASSSELLCVSFNQDGSCVSIGTRRGYTIANAEPFGKIYSRNDAPVSIVEMLFCTSLVAWVGTADSSPNSSPRRLQIVNTKRQSTICELLFPTTILGVKLNRRRLVVILEEEIYIYDISNMKLLHTIETSPNPGAICALSPSSDPCYLAYPSPVPSPTSGAGASTDASSSSSSSSSSSKAAGSPGDVLIFDLLSLSVTNIVQAHKAPISCLALNATGTLLATASDKGTVIRVFSVPSAQKLHQFRRGSYPAKVYHLGFNAVSTLLSVSSDTETVHIFKLGGSQGAGAGAGAGPAATAAAAGGARNGVARQALPPAAAGATSPYDGSEASSSGSPPGSANGGGGGGGGGRGGFEAFIDDKKKRPSFSGSLRKRSMALSRAAAGSVGTYLPSSLAEMWEPARDFAHLKLPTPGVSSVVSVSSTTPQVLVATSDGYFYTYQIDLEQGGECTLMKQHSLLDNDDSSANAAASSMAD